MMLANLIEQLGGDVAVAAACGCSRPAVYAWRTRGLPAGRVNQLARLARKKRIPVDVERLLALTTAAKPRAKRP